MLVTSGNNVVISTDHVATAERLIKSRFEELGSLALDLAFIDMELLGGTGDQIARSLLERGMPKEALVNISATHHDMAGVSVWIPKSKPESLPKEWDIYFGFPGQVGFTEGFICDRD